jgi:tetratricopeptide (TPR) repeat protein
MRFLTRESFFSPASSPSRLRSYSDFLFLPATNPDKAEDAFNESLMIRKNLGNEQGQAIVLGSWGRALLESGNYQEAFGKLQASFEIYEALKDRQGICIVVPLLIRACKLLGQEENAREFYLRALVSAPNDERLLRLQKEFVK